MIPNDDSREDDVRGDEEENQGQKEAHNVSSVALVHPQEVALVQHLHLEVLEPMGATYSDDDPVEVVPE